MAVAMIDWNQVRHFRRDEWRKDPDLVRPELVFLTDEIRERAGSKIVLLVAFDLDGHSKTSKHKTGEAVDLYFQRQGLSFMEQFELLKSFAVSKIGGLGCYPYWKPFPGWHIDIRKRVDRLYWWRNKAEKYLYGLREITKGVNLASTMFPSG